MVRHLLQWMLLLAAFMMPGAVNAQVDVFIGNEEATDGNSYLPTYSYYNYSFTQQIYTAEEIGLAGTISSVSFKNVGTAKTRTVSLYVAHTNKSGFESSTDWVGMSDSNLVFTGSVTFTAGDWTTIDFDTPFAYDGSSNLLISVADNSGTWSSGLQGLVFPATGQALRIYRDASAFDVANPGTGGGLLDVKNQIMLHITAAGALTCDRPTAMTVSGITGVAATVAWESEVGSYTVEYKKSADEVWTVIEGVTANSMVLTQLDPQTNYSVRVKALCGADLESAYKVATFTTLEVCPEGKVCVGQGSVTNAELPTNNYFNYGLSQQIYTAEELGQAGYVLSLDFFKNSATAMTKNLDIYMVHTNKTGFESASDWVAVTAADRVFSGSVTFADTDWTTINLDYPFQYDGTSNVVLVVDNNTGTCVSGTYFYVFETTGNQALYYRNDNTNLNPLSAISTTGTLSNKKNRVRFGIGEPPSCSKPTAVTVTYEGGTTATVSWTSDATSWGVSVNGETTIVTENPYTLTDLQLATTYEVMVIADCGTAVSEWSTPVSFTTELCLPENRCNLTLELTDSYGDGWNGNAILVTDVLTGEVLGQFTNTSLAMPNVAEVYPLSVCDGREIQFSWVTGSYVNETSYTVKDVNGEVIFSGAGAISTPVIYTVSCFVTNCKKPSGLTLTESGSHSATLTWTENGEATAWVVAYKTDDDEVFSEELFTADSVTLTGLLAAQLYTVKVRPACEDGSVRWSDPISVQTLPGNAIPTDVVVDVLINDATISWSVAPTNVLHQSFDLYWAPADTTFVPDDEELTAPNYISGITNTSYVITGLAPATDYKVWLRDNCGTDGISDWTTSVGFTTLPPCPAPILEDEGVTDVTNHTAAVAWSGYDVTNSYIVNYRKAATFDGVNEKFDAEPAGWRKYVGALDEVMAGSALDSTGLGWYYDIYNDVFDNHAYINIYGAFRKYWLVTPELTVPVGGTLDFDLALTAYGGSVEEPYTSGTDDKFVVLITTDNMQTWTIVRQWDNADSSQYVYNDITCSAEGEHVSIDLAAYVGQNVKVAFYGESTVSNADNNIHIDNVEIGKGIPAGEWRSVAVDGTSVNLTGLVAETDYEVTVTGLCVDEDSNTSAPVFFTTLIGCPAPTEFTVGTPTAHDVELGWAGDAAVWQIAYKTMGEETYTTLQVTEANSYTLGNLLPETEYSVKMRTYCGEDGYSAWTREVTFVTLATCPAPAIGEVVDVTGHTAQVSWSAFDANNNFEVNYRTPAFFAGLNEEFGTSMPTGWAAYTGRLSSVMAGYGLTNNAYTWSFGAGNGVFDNHARANVYGNYQRWLVTPAFTVREHANILEFDLALTNFSGTLAAPQTNGVDDKFVVLVTTDNMISWIILRQWDNEEGSGNSVYNNIACTATGDHVTISLADYVGQNVKIAFYAESTAANADNNLHIDNVHVGQDIPASAWQTVATSDTSVTLTNLNAETLYEVFVSLQCADEAAQSDTVTFQTTISCPDPEGVEVTVGENGAVTFAVTDGYGVGVGYEYQYWRLASPETKITGVSLTDTWTITLPSGTYGWRVRINCGEDDNSFWVSGDDFAVCTPYEVTVDNPFVETLLSNSESLPCWDYNGTVTNGWHLTYDSEGVDWFYSGFYGDAYLFSPVLQLPESGEVTLFFSEYITYLDDYAQNSVYVVPEGGSIGMIEPIWAPDITKLEEDVALNRQFSLNDYRGQTIRVVFKYEGSNAHGWYVNNFSVTVEDNSFTVREVAETVCDRYELRNSADELVDTFTVSGLYERIYEDPELGTIHATLDLTIGHKEHSYTEVASCGPYTWDLTGQTYNKSGLKFNKGTTPEGCLIRDTLALTINVGTTSENEATACDSYQWNGATYTESGVYTYTTTNAAGCDSTATLNLTIVYKQHSYTEVNSCGPYTWDLTGQTYKKSGLKFYKGTTPEGCLIRDTLALTINVGTTSENEATACDSYQWNDATYTESGVYTYNTTNAAGCDSTATLNLTIVYKQHSYTEVTNCGSYTWELTGQTYNKSGLKFNKGTTPEGCLIRDTLNLTIVSEWYSSEEATACDSYTWDKNGETYTETGVYTYTHVDETGCPVNEELNLTVGHKDHSYTEVFVCDLVASYTWDLTGQTYNKSGLKFNKGTNDEGCPIRDTLNLQFVSKWSSYEEVLACESYTWDKTGQTYKKAGIKTYKDTAEDGCPVRDTINLIIGQKESSYTEVTNCGSYTWELTGQTYNKSGLKFNKTTNEYGCPVRDTLRLTIIDRYSSRDTVISCDGSYYWDKTDKTYNKTGFKYYKGTAEDGCPIRDTLYVIISQSEHSYVDTTSYGPFYWDKTDKTYNKSGLKFYKAANEYGCPIRDTLNLTVLPASAAPESYEYQIAENESPIEAPETIEAAQLTSLNAVKVYPNPTTGRIQINVTEAEKVEVLDLVGRLVAVYENTNTLDLTNLADGTYTLRITMAEGVALRKVVKR